MGGEGKTSCGERPFAICVRGVCRGVGDETRKQTLIVAIADVSEHVHYAESPPESEAKLSSFNFMVGWKPLGASYLWPTV